MSSNISKIDWTLGNTSRIFFSIVYSISNKMIWYINIVNWFMVIIIIQKIVIYNEISSLKSE